MYAISVARRQQRGGHWRRGHVAGRWVQLGASSVAGRIRRGRRRPVSRRRQPCQHPCGLLLRHPPAYHHRSSVWPNGLLLPVRRRQTRALVVSSTLKRSRWSLWNSIPIDGSKPLSEHRCRQFSVLLPFGTYRLAIAIIICISESEIIGMIYLNCHDCDEMTNF